MIALWIGKSTQSNLKKKTGSQVDRRRSTLNPGTDERKSRRSNTSAPGIRSPARVNTLEGVQSMKESSGDLQGYSSMRRAGVSMQTEGAY